MANDPSFPPALKDLAKSGIGVAAAPAGGMGFALTADGKIPGGVLFLGSDARRIVTGYSGTQTTDGGGHVKVAHGLGVVPACTLGMSDTAVSTRAIVSASHDATNLDFFFNAAGVSVAFWWLAIG